MNSPELTTVTIIAANTSSFVIDDPLEKVELDPDLAKIDYAGVQSKIDTLVRELHEGQLPYLVYDEKKFKIVQHTACEQPSLLPKLSMDKPKWLIICCNAIKYQGEDYLILQKSGYDTHVGKLFSMPALGAAIKYITKQNNLNCVIIMGNIGDDFCAELAKRTNYSIPIVGAKCQLLQSEIEAFCAHLVVKLMSGESMYNASTNAYTAILETKHRESYGKFEDMFCIITK